METSDDPTTITAIATVAAAGAGIHAATQGGGGGGQRVAQAGQPKQTAEPTTQLSEQAKRNRRLAASSLTRQFAEPTLGTPGLLGG